MLGGINNSSQPSSSRESTLSSPEVRDEKTTIPEQIAWLKGASHGFETSLDHIDRVEKKQQSLHDAKLKLERLLGVVKMYEEIRPRGDFKK